MVRWIMVKVTDRKTTNFGGSIRDKISRAFGLLSVGLFSTGVFMLVMVCFTAWREGLFIFPGRPEYSNHGYWHGHDALSYGSTYALLLPLYAFISALLSLIFKPNNQALMMLVLSVGFDIFAFLFFLPFLD